MSGNESFDNVPAPLNDQPTDPFGGQGALPGGTSSFAPFSSGAPKKTISSQTIIVVVIAVLAAGLVFGMRKFGMGPVMSLTEVKIDYEPNLESEAERAESIEVMAELSQTSTPTQIPSGWIERDPFMLPVTQTIEVPDQIDETPEIDPEAIRLAQLRGSVNEAIENVEIQSVMGGRVPLARINGETVRIGDKVEEVLTLVAIDGRAAIFEGDDGRKFRAETGEDLKEVQPKD